MFLVRLLTAFRAFGPAGFLTQINKSGHSLIFFAISYAGHDKEPTFAASNLKRKDNKMKKVLDLLLECLKEMGTNILRGGYEVA